MHAHPSDSSPAGADPAPETSLDAAAVHDRVVRRPIRRLQFLTLVTGVLSAAATAGVLALQSVSGYARAVLEARAWGAVAVTDADVASFLTPPGLLPAAVVGILAATALLMWGAARLIGATRWVGTVLVGIGLLTAAFWMVDGGRMVAAGGAGPLVLASVVAMLIACAAWLFITHLRSTRDAFDG
ncbi:hypothetical protein KZX06_04265 [Micrococcus sp. EYE_162]|uniref:hypothetical protein n=1 Tax=Micrococcus TaxID=1269 RepID=UPI002003B8DA|nr:MULTISPECIES: hypothetical protein [unclassified Micrococcus]MCK6094686.1 hypothetical protein [Micrococcus sp. EYE_212]MCK6171262.1 hypothetical protein [Micrococcus sp. EYE_162]